MLRLSSLLLHSLVPMMLDPTCEMTVEQKFNSHLVPERHRVRQSIIEFKDFATIWWNELVNTCDAPQTWNALKEEMRARFVPPYRCDLQKNCNT
jgi:hypothetical protein